MRMGVNDMMARERQTDALLDLRRENERMREVLTKRIEELEADIIEGGYRFGTMLATRDKRIEELEAGLRDAVDYLYNPFEPDNQSRTYTRLKDILTPVPDPSGGNK